MRIKITLLFITIGLILFNIWLFRSLLHAKKDAQRLEDSFATANRDVNYFQSVNGQMAVRIKTLELKNQELNRIYPQIIKEIENLKIKSNRVNQYSETIIHQDKEIIKVLRDSVIYDTIKIKAFDFEDSYYKVFGSIQNDFIKLNIHSYDSLIQVVFKGQRKKPWLWIFSKRQIEQIVSCKNPNSTIKYSRFIQIEK